MTTAAATSPPASHPIYRALSAAGVPRLARRLRGGAQVFCFHDVVPPEETGVADVSLHMSRPHFERVVEWIATTYRVLPLREILDRLERGAPVAGTAALTFDDAYRGFFEHGLPVLRRAALPATVFVVVDASRAPGPFWWDVLGLHGALGAEQRRECLDLLCGDGARVLQRHGLAGDSHPVPESFRPLPWEALRTEVARDDLLELGAHTMRHRNLSVLEPSDLEDELASARTAMEAETGCPPDVVSYPYGRYDRRVVEAARSAGYRAGFTLDRGTVRSGADTLALPRLNVPAGIGVEALECWASGLRKGGGDA